MPPLACTIWRGREAFLASALRVLVRRRTRRVPRASEARRPSLVRNQAIHRVVPDVPARHGGAIRGSIICAFLGTDGHKAFAWNAYHVCYVCLVLAMLAPAICGSLFVSGSTVEGEGWEVGMRVGVKTGAVYPPHDARHSPSDALPCPVLLQTSNAVPFPELTKLGCTLPWLPCVSSSCSSLGCHLMLSCRAMFSAHAWRFGHVILLCDHAVLHWQSLRRDAQSSCPHCGAGCGGLGRGAVSSCCISVLQI